ncbi:TIGR04222 domain-containing membrane protein [Nostoc sp. CENA543]|uniref:TIGR04222 domain-containing membrane protein n=1 Tax=Nostoc sp. CENA543 TaxID=1869241 RepID=UPI000CA13AC1|nr:TIGR04222 domain-containing membrane protein [Nostoc sp. CENA543]AUT02292.1 TIGR04222 domain-containing membrane protein [Nostoc sp. CENA543]
MDSLLHNPIADMYGPDFLVLYGSVIAITLVVCWRLVQDPNKNQPLPLIPANPDPYKIAYLRSQNAGIAHTALFNLILQGYLQVSEQSISQTPDHPDVAKLQPIENAVFQKISIPSTATASLWLASQVVQPYSHNYEEQLHSEQLLTTTNHHQWRIQVGLIGAMIIFSLGGYKLLIALAKGRYNVGFLIIMGVASIIWLMWLVSKRSLLNDRGKKYLQQLQETFSQLKSKAKSQTASLSEYNLLVALFGVEALAGTVYNPYHEIFFPPQFPKTTSRYSSSSSSSSSCSGASGCGGGSSCSSSSCSSSSCGSSCGGGCGGCGGS